MIDNNIFNALVKVESLWINTLINQKFVIKKVDDLNVHCTAVVKLKRGQSKSAVSFQLPKTLFWDYTEIKKEGQQPTFVKLR